MFYSADRNQAWRYFQRIEVRVGEDDPGASYDSIIGKNARCSSFWNNGESMKYYDFKCSTPGGIKGKYVTITSQRSHGAETNKDILSAAEVEIFGKTTLLI